MADTFEIITQTNRTRSDAPGQYSYVKEVTFKTKPSGQVSSIDVPLQMYSVDEVNRQVATAAALIEQVQKL